MHDTCRTVIVRSTPGWYEPRFCNAVDLLQVVNGPSIQVINWKRTENYNSIVKAPEHSFRSEAEFGKGFLNYFKHLKFILHVYGCLKKMKPQLIYVCDFETFLPVYFWSLTHNAVIVYDQFDPIHAKTRSRIFGKCLYRIEIEALRKVKIKLTANISRIPKKERDNWIEMKNLFPNHSGVSENKLRKNRKILFYGGILQSDRLLINCIDVISVLEDWEMHIFGKGPEFKKIEARQSSNVILHNETNHVELMTFAQQADLYLALYDPKIENNKFTASNKLYEAAQLQIPLITSMDTSIGDTVRNFGLGWVIDPFVPAEFFKVFQNYSTLSGSELLDIKDNLSSFLAREKLIQKMTIDDLKSRIEHELTLGVK
jgi:glycosyltransferase involved in cell wall biosynthesis